VSRLSRAERRHVLTTFIQGEPTTMTPATTDAARLFDAGKLARRFDSAKLERVPLEEIELAPNPRKRINEEGIDFLSELMMRNGQVTSAIAWRNPKTGKVILYAGQRRLLAARRSHELAGTDGYEDLAPIGALRCMLFAGQRPPTQQEITRLQAMENQGREDLSLADLQDQFEDCWRERAGLPDDERMAAVCQDMGINPKLAHNLRRQNTLPEEVRRRVATRRSSGEQISVSMANALADINDVAPQLAQAVARRLTSDQLHDAAMRDLGAFVHRTSMDDEDTYTVRLAQGHVLQGDVEMTRARKHLGDAEMQRLPAVLGCEDKEVVSALDKLSKRAKDTSLLITVDEALCDRVTSGRYGWRYDRGERFAQSIWLVDPIFMIDLIADRLGDASDDAPKPTGERYFAGGGSDKEAKEAAAAERARRDSDREHQRRAAEHNLGLGLDIDAKLVEPTPEQLDALRRIVCHLIAERFPDVIAYGAGWTNPDRQQPVGDTGRHEPRAVPAVIDAELTRALEHRDPLVGIAHLIARFGAAFLLDIDGIPRTKALGTERMGRKLSDALPAGENPVRSAVWEFMRPMLSQPLVEAHYDEFVIEAPADSTVDLAAHRGETALEDLDLGDDLAQAA